MVVVGSRIILVFLCKYVIIVHNRCSVPWLDICEEKHLRTSKNVLFEVILCY